MDQPLSHCMPALALLPRAYHLMPTVEHLLLECPIRAPHLTLQRQVFSCWHQVICTWQQDKCYLINDNMQEYSAEAVLPFVLHYSIVYVYGLKFDRHCSLSKIDSWTKCQLTHVTKNPAQSYIELANLSSTELGFLLILTLSLDETGSITMRKSHENPKIHWKISKDKLKVSWN
jgi:hypothetical protein